MNKQKKGMRTFIIIWLGQLMSMMGSGLIGFALGVWIYAETGQATPFAMTALFSILPRILLSPITGAVSDRWNRKRIMLIADSLSGVATLVTAVLLLTGRMEIWMVYTIAFFESIFASFQQPAYSASIVLLVPKSQLTRANSLIQMGQAIETILTPVLAGALIATIGMQGIIIIDAVTYLIAVCTLIFVSIPQPEKTSAPEGGKTSLFSDIAFGWRYLVERRGLLGLTFYFASVNFFLNICGVMIGPLILSFGTAASLGVAQTVMGAGMLAGSLLMSVWGGPKKKKIDAVFAFILLASLGFVVAGVQPTLLFISIGTFILVFFIPFASGPSSAISAAKVAPDVQGRVAATRSMISQSMMPIAFLLSGILADHVFNPLLVEGGALADTFVGAWLGVGEGRGIGLMMICSGLFLFIVSAIAYANPRIRNIETEIPDAIPDDTEMKTAAETEEPQPSTASG
jgi:DHA3 family macrolide efflux protein-like MFS transporter